MARRVGDGFDSGRQALSPSYGRKAPPNEQSGLKVSQEPAGFAPLLGVETSILRSLGRRMDAGFHPCPNESMYPFESTTMMRALRDESPWTRVFVRELSLDFALHDTDALNLPIQLPFTTSP